MILLAGLILAGGAAATYLKVDPALKFVDLTSGNPNWQPPPATGLDLFVQSFPAGWVLLAGVVLLAAGVAARYLKRGGDVK